MMYSDRRCSACTEADKGIFGCTIPVRQAHTFPGDAPLFTCPLTYFRDHPHLEGAAFSLHMHWSKGILPVEGGLEDQPANFEPVIAATNHGVQVGKARLQEVEQRNAEKEGKKTSRGKRGGR